MKPTAKFRIDGIISKSPVQLYSPSGNELDALEMEIMVEGYQGNNRLYTVQAWRDDRSMFHGLRKGQMVRVEGNLNSREYNDRKYYDLRAENVLTHWEAPDQEQPQQPQQGRSSRQERPQQDGGTRQAGQGGYGQQQGRQGYQQGRSSRSEGQGGYGYGYGQQQGGNSYGQPQSKEEDDDIPF